MVGHGALERAAAAQRLLDGGRLWIKLSAPDRWPDAITGGRLRSVVEMLARHAPERLVWGSDWPHTPFHDNRPAAHGAMPAYRAIDTAAKRAIISEALGPAAGRVFKINTDDIYV